MKLKAASECEILVTQETVHSLGTGEEILAV